MGATIEMRNLTKRYGDVVALDDLSLTVESGEFLVLLGPSGCGKTTLLRSLSGLETPDEGEILIDGKVIFSSDRGIRVPPGKRDIGMVFQSCALWPHMKVKDNIGFGLRVQKVDEPLSNLDARLRVDMRAELKRFHRDSDATTVFVTHDQTEAMTMASLIVVMNQGRMQQAAPPLDLYRQPANLFVADFIGMPRINLLEAELTADGDQPAARIGDFTIPLAWRPPKQELMVAARPEDVAVMTSPEKGAIEFKVHTVLPSGPEVIIQLTRGNVVLVVRDTRQLDLTMDQTAWVRFDPLALNLYDRSDGTMLVPESDPSDQSTGLETTESLAR
jgi:multiple sugar transport system ATP-binding protein